MYLIKGAYSRKCNKVQINYGIHLQTKIIENKIQFEVQKLDYPCETTASYKAMYVMWAYTDTVTVVHDINNTWTK